MTNDAAATGKPKDLYTEQLVAEEEAWLGDGALREMREDSSTD